jgi:uncharacterized cupin superfamily protein
MADPNVFVDEPWEMEIESMGVQGRRVGAAAGAKELGATVYVLAPGASGFNLHTHYGIEELFVVLDGRPTLRTGEAERELAPGDVVACPRGPEGMHTFANRSDEPARVLAVSTIAPADIAVYPELGKVGVATRHPFDPPGDDPGVLGMFDLPKP